MLAKLLLTACLLTDPSHCVQFAPLYDKKGVVECTVLGETAMKQWQDEHPGSKWTITKWGCQMGERPGRMSSDPDLAEAGEEI